MYLAGLLPLAAMGQTGEPAPVFVLGDTWTFERIVLPSRREPWTETVERITPDAVLMMLPDRRRRFSPVANPLDQLRGEIPLMRFPLAIGATWKHAHDWSSSTGNLKTTTSMQYKVVGVEEVMVPAGKFHAYKLVANGFVKDHSTITPVGGDARATETYWYSPVVKRIVKYEGKHLKWIPPNFIETWSLAYELRSYSLQAAVRPPEPIAADPTKPEGTDSAQSGTATE
jgi:hypothetical protein